MSTFRTAALTCLLALALPAQQKFSRQRVDWNKPIKPFHILGNIYFVGTAGLGSYLITSPQGDVLLDGALPESAPQIEQHVAVLGFRLRDVKILLNTHAHYDHDGGLRQLKRDSGAQMIASSGDAPDLESGLTNSFGGGWDTRIPGVKVDRIIDDGAQVKLGDIVLTAHITPGHTKGCTTWTMPVTDAGHIWNVVFYCSTSVPGYSLVNNRFYPNIVSDYRHSFTILQSLPCDVFLANHTGFFHLNEKLARLGHTSTNPFIDPAEYVAFVAQSKQDFEDTLRQQQAAAARKH